VAAAAKKRIVLSLGILVLMLGIGVLILGFLLLGDIDLTIAANPNSFEAQEANRKLKLLSDAQAANKQGFVRLSEAEINGFLQNRYGKAEKNRTNEPLKLVKAGVLLHQNDLTFVTWYKAPLLGIELPLVCQRLVTPQRMTNGWRLSLDEVRIGKLPIPRNYWPQISQFLSTADKVFEDKKVWLASLPTVMISHNEINRTPELRLYNYVPVIKPEADPLATPEAVTTSAPSSSNTLSAKLSL
jgi:hypothetical protein